MTRDQEIKLADYQAKYDAAKAAYEEELSQNAAGKANLAAGIYVFPWNGQRVTETDLRNWLIASDASLSTKKTKMQSAFNDLEGYKEQISQGTLNEFASTNPELYAQYLKDKITAPLDAQKQLFAAKSTWYILGGVVFIAIVIAGIIIYKRYKAGK